TLMEEVAHVFLGHKANRLAVINEQRSEVRGQRSDKRKSNDQSPSHIQTLARDYNHDDEEAAYAVGSAALVPYAALRRLVRRGRDAAWIARHFRVSRQLVEYRIKVTHLWQEYKRASTTRAEYV
ncbi:MAG TPA: ImmA/IrrE family metallo-endopeptidase, partial [Pyrinomonadaceae bacterium]|nr:ImmA/IrrE family metallo-endopeptidase [Pyrinomonadaceae bacterium]